MQLRRNHRRHALVAAFGLGAAMALAVPAQAQEAAQQAQVGGRMRILIPPVLEHPAGVDASWGKKVADQFRAGVDKMPRHQAVPLPEIKDNLKKYKIKEETLDCVKERQLAVQIGAELVMCGNYEPQAGGGMKLTTQFIGAKTGETFEVPPITATTPEDAGAKISAAFNTYVTQLGATAFCQQYLGSQQWASAITNCNAALAVNPNNSTALYQKARALMEMDSLQASMDALKGVMKINPMHSDAIRMAGVVAAKLGDENASSDYFKQYLELNPGDANVRLNIAGDAAKATNLEGALKIVEEGFKSDSANAQLLLYAGHWALGAAQKLETAAREKDQPKPAKADSLALVALRYYQRLIASKDTATDPSVVKNAILIMTSHNQAPQAVQLGQKFTSAGDTWHKNAEIWSVYADALNAAGQSQNALAALDTAAAYDTKGELPVFAKKGQWLAEKGQLSAAKAALSQAIQKGKVKADDAANLIFGFGYNKYRDKEYDGALSYFAASRELAGTAETRGQAWFWAGIIYAQRGTALAQANPKKASPAAAAQLRLAQDAFGNAGAYLSSHASAARQANQYGDYIKSYLEAVRKAAQ